jgi:hypothetical protein
MERQCPIGKLKDKPAFMRSSAARKVEREKTYSTILKAGKFQRR